ncbi:Efflux pump radE [Psilocybe cubensis]|uniref:Efflux pump radE n=1 Tax=Psilocybe cubensis TaxID=181762 RepID=A0ACB8GSJ1_PSICU|nr:Efflux pump radE [Psilocybe cubensis]KAH9478196.1 Efflux pump radE [Psilocybe cubensis]
MSGREGRVADLESGSIAFGAASTAPSTIVPGSNVSMDVDVDISQTRKSSTINDNLGGGAVDVDIGSEKLVKCPTSIAVIEEKIQLKQEEEDEEWESDPANARNWSTHRKWISMAVVALYTLIPPLASSMMSPGLPELAEKFDIHSSTILAMTLTVFLISLALGPLILAPLSEMYGRTWILHVGNLLSIVFNLSCAFAPNTAALIAFRFLCGLSGGAPIAIGGGTVSDLFAPRERAVAMGMFNLGPLLGPAIGPVAGGYITQTVGIKWVFIVIAIFCAVGSVIGIPLLRETYAPVIRMRKAQREGNEQKAARAHPMLIQARGNMTKILWINLTRPLEMLFGSFICFIMSLFMAFIYGIYYLMFSTFANLFSDTYGFGPGAGGLAYIGLGVGFILSTVWGARGADALYKYLADRNGGKGKPEMRIPSMLIGSLLVPIGLFWYGWSAQARIHWIMPIIGTAIFGFGILPITLYLVDAFKFAASALAAASVFRSILGFAFPLFGDQMYKVLGEGPGNSMLAGLAIVLGIPFPIWIYYRGEAMRARNPMTR